MCVTVWTSNVTFFCLQQVNFGKEPIGSKNQDVNLHPNPNNAFNTC